MDEDRLRQQLNETGNLLDVLSDDAWHLAEDWDGPVEVGLDLGSYLDAIAATPSADLAKQRRCVRILSILYPELRRWLESWNLGQSFEPVYAEAQRRVYDHVRQLTPEQEQWMDALIAEYAQELPIEARELRSQVIPFLSSLMTTDDRQALADIAAQHMAQGVLQLVQVDYSVAV